MYKFIFSIIAICLAHLSAAQANYGEWVPTKVTIQYNGIPHQIISKDLTTNEEFSSCLAYCRAIGYVNANHCGNYLLGAGPYVELNEKGQVIRALPAEGNENRFWILAGGSYCSLPY